MSLVLVQRRFAGIGDWLMTLAVLKLVNRQRPDVDLWVNFETQREPMPPIVPQAFRASDVTFREASTEPASVVLEHLVYRRNGVGFIEDMAAVFTRRAGVPVRYEPGVFPKFTYPRPAAVAGYVAMCSQGKAAGPKDYGYDNFAALAELIAPHRDIVQIGAATDRPLPQASRHVLGQPFDSVATALAGADLYIGIENGVTVLAGFLDVPLLTLYCGVGHPARLRFRRHSQLVEAVTPERAAAAALAAL